MKGLYFSLDHVKVATMMEKKTVKKNIKQKYHTSHKLITGVTNDYFNSLDKLPAGCRTQLIPPSYKKHFHALAIEVFFY